MKILIAEQEEGLRQELARRVTVLPGVEQVWSIGDRGSLQRIAEEQPINLIITDFYLTDGEAISTLHHLYQKKRLQRTIIYTDSLLINHNIDLANQGRDFTDLILIKELGVSWLMEYLAKVFPILNRPHPSQDQFVKKLVIHQQDGIYFLEPEEILFIEKVQKQVVLHTKDQVYTTYATLSEMEAQLPSFFFRSHRSFLVNLHQVKGIAPSGRSYLIQFGNLKEEAFLSSERQKELLELVT